MIFRYTVVFAICGTVGSCFLACPSVGPSAEEAQAYRIPNNSMEPTLLAGDRLLARALHGPPRRNQLAVYETVSGRRVKRVVGLPGDTIAMRVGLLTVNGTVVNEPYSVPHDLVSPDFAWQRRFLAVGVDTRAYRPTLNSWGPLVVPAGQFFVLGDNRGASADSRYTGFVPLEAMVQEPTIIYFSRDPDTGSIRWSRIGRSLSESQ